MRSNSKSPSHYPRRKLILNSGEIYLPKHKKLKLRDVSFQTIEKSDKFTSYKEECKHYSILSDQLPNFSINFYSGNSSDKSKSLDVKNRLRTLESRPDRYRIKSNLRSKTIVGDNNF